MNTITYLSFALFVLCGALLAFSLDGQQWDLALAYGIATLLATAVIWINNKIYKNK